MNTQQQEDQVKKIEEQIFPEIRKNLKNVPNIKLFYDSNRESDKSYFKIKNEKIRKGKLVEEAIFVLLSDKEKVSVAVDVIKKIRIDKKIKKEKNKNKHIEEKERRFNKYYDGSSFPRGRRKDAYKYFVLNEKVYPKQITAKSIEKYIKKGSAIEGRDFLRDLRKKLKSYCEDKNGWYVDDYSLKKKELISIGDFSGYFWVEVFMFDKDSFESISESVMDEPAEDIIRDLSDRFLSKAIAKEKEIIKKAYNEINNKICIENEDYFECFRKALKKYHYDDIYDQYIYNLFVMKVKECDVFSKNQKSIFLRRFKFRNKININVFGADILVACFLDYKSNIRNNFLNFLKGNEEVSISYKKSKIDGVYERFNFDDFLRKINDLMISLKSKDINSLIDSYIDKVVYDVMEYSQRNYDYKKLNAMSKNDVREIFFYDFAKTFSNYINQDKDSLKREINVEYLDGVKDSIFEDLKGIVKNYLIKELIKIDYKNSFPLARKLKRKVKFFMGETNSGKTYQAFNELVKARSGVYLSPLRLLALEGQEEIEKRGKVCSMMTGEESDIKDGASFKSSTIEMLNTNEYVESVIIDEIQMLRDTNRGWAWVQALIGCPAENIILAGSEEVLGVVKKLVEYTGDELEVIEFKRKSPLVVMDNVSSLKDIKPGTAIIAFSRRKVLEIKDKLKSRNVSVIYGNLGPEVRKEEARKFRDGETDILIATDAIAMGLNLPIETILFSTHEKNIRGERFEIEEQLVLQIAGRAGRYGIKNKGYVGALSNSTLRYVKSIIGKKIEPYDGRVPIMPNVDYLEKIQSVIKSEKLRKVLMAFEKYADFKSDLFFCTDLEKRIELADIIDDYGFSLPEGFMLSSAPVRENYDGGVDYFEMYIKFLFDAFYGDNERLVRSPKIDKFVSLKRTNSSDFLKEAEELMHNLDLYNWFSNRYYQMFFEIDKVTDKKAILNNFIINSLKRS